MKIKVVSFSTITLLLCAFLRVSSAADDTYRGGWDALAHNDYEVALKYFRDITKLDDSNIRSWLGISLAYNALGDRPSSWKAYQKALALSDNPHAYLYAAAYQGRTYIHRADSENPIAVAYRNVAKTPDQTGLLAAISAELLGRLYGRLGDLKKSKSYFDGVQGIQDWRVMGPFDNTSSSGHDKVYPPEMEDSEFANYAGRSSVPVKWMTVKHHRTDHWIDFARYYPSVRGTFYAITYVHSPAVRRVQFRLGTSGSHKVLLNDELVSETWEETNNGVDTYVTEVNLYEGWNKIIVKCSSYDIEACNFYLRITDEGGRVFPDIGVSSRKQSYTPGNAALPRRLENPYIVWFREQISLFPERMENYYFLAECYLKNDYYIEAERVLGAALRRWPSSVLLMAQMLEAYYRAGQEDDRISLLEKILVMAPLDPLIQNYRFSEAFRRKDFDEAESIIALVEPRKNEVTDYYEFAIRLARERRQIKRVNELQLAAYKAFPEIYDYAAAVALMTLESTRQHSEAIRIIKEHLKYEYNASALSLLARIYRDQGDMAAWEDVYDKMFVLTGVAPGYHISRAEVYATHKKYAKAYSEIMKAIEITPSASHLWYRAGILARTMMDNDVAQNCFTRAIELDPGNFDARNLLRDLRGEPSPFKELQPASIDDAIRNAPPFSEASKDRAVYIMDNKYRVVYSGGFSEVKHDIVIRINTKEGIDAFKEYNLPYTVEGTTVEKAVVRTKGGREIQADQDLPMLVFKGLDVGDFIIISVRARFADYSLLSPYYWDEFQLNGFYPALQSVYAVRIPKNSSMRWQVNNWNVSPVISDAGDYLIYEWRVENEPGIEPEESMPSISDVAKQVQITSVDSWAVFVDWYSDLARHKTRVTDQVAEVMDTLCPVQENLSDREVIERVYSYITTHIRYSYVPFRQSAITPQKARLVLSNRIGDCKDVSALCISMLATRNINAYFVLVQTNSSPVQKPMLPSIPFDHAIVVVALPEGSLFLDLTAPNLPLGSVPFADINAYALIIKPGERYLVRLEPRLFNPSNVYSQSTIDIAPDNSATISQTFRHTGTRSMYYRTAWKDKGQADREKEYLEMLSEDFSSVQLLKLDVENLDTLASDIRFSIVYKVPDFTIEAGNSLVFRVPKFDRFQPARGLSYESRKFPILFHPRADTIIEVSDVVVRGPYDIDTQNIEVALNHPVFSYSTNRRIVPGSVSMTRRVIYNRYYALPEEYETFREHYNRVVREDRRYVLLRPKTQSVSGSRVRKR